MQRQNGSRTPGKNWALATAFALWAIYTCWWYIVQLRPIGRGLKGLWLK